MKALELVGEVDEQRQLRAVLPEGAPAGMVRVLVLWPEENVAAANGGATVPPREEASSMEAAPADEGAVDEELVDDDWAKLRQLIRECAVDTGIEDLAHQHDHYLYGTPKRPE